VIDHLARIRLDADALAATLSHDTAGLPVRACPDWDLRALASHMGHIHRWARAAVRDGAAPDPEQIEPPPEHIDDLAQWVRDGGSALVAELASAPAGRDVWHPFPVPLEPSVWPRRQAQETSVHRWDAQDAVGAAAPIDAELAADGVDEYFTVMLPRMLQRRAATLAVSTPAVSLVCDDTPGTWTVRAVDAHPVLDDDAAPVARVRGSAEDLLLVLWGRRELDRLDVDGDRDAALVWLTLGGN
jgi:uncharacterized protein (TIGR03083 family)